MTLLQITAIDVDEHANGCCRGSIQQAAIGRAREPMDAAEILHDLSEGSNSYFAQIDGRFVDVAAAQCPTCRSTYLTSAEAITARVDNELLRLPQVDRPTAAPSAEEPAPPRGNWRQRLHPHSRERVGR